MVLLGLAVGLGLSTGWQPRPALASAFGLLPDLKARGDAAAPRATQALRKCAQGDKMLYTDALCPPGSRELAVGGQLSVVPSPAAQAKTSAASAPRNVRELLVPADGVDLKAERIDALIGK